MMVICLWFHHRRDYSTTQVDSKRAMINMIHDNVALTVSAEEATRADEETKRRLLSSKKLILVVDLDQTIIHATVDPTVAEWQKDPNNPNYDAIKDVRAFQLVDDTPGGRGTWYYIKLRPGLKEFLENISKIYELHIYTMGTRAYAKNIAEIIDPDRKIFGDRILSRDESGSLVAKSLQRLFPTDTRMVVIIDDRGDVWGWNANLVKVTQFSFFIGIGDINSSFLPKKPKIGSTSKAKKAVPDPKQDQLEGASSPEPELKVNGDGLTNGKTIDGELIPQDAVSALEQMVSMSGGDNPSILQEQTAKQDEALTAQLQDRPLLQKQKELEAEEDSESDTEKPRHPLLNNDDNELYFLEQSLRRVHTEYFDTYARKLANVQGGRIAQLRGGQTSSRKVQPSANLDLELVPEIQEIMPAVKSRVLAGVAIVFSGVIPLDTDTQNAEISLWARSFGAKIQEDISGKATTHVVAARNRTAKVRQAVRRGKGKIKIVGLQWLMDCIVQWQKVDEIPYLLETDEANIGKPFPGENDEILSESEDVDSPLDTDSEAPANDSSDNPSKSTSKRLVINTKNVRNTTTDDEDVEGLLPDDIEDDKSPVGGTQKDWAEMHDEMADFLGSDAEDDESDTESLASGESGNSGGAPRSKAPPKRSYAEMADEPTGDDAEEKLREAAEEARKRRRMPVIKQAFPEDTGLPTPDGTADRPGEDYEEQEEDSGNTNQAHDDEDDDGGWSEFEGAFEKEMARDAEEDEEEGKAQPDAADDMETEKPANENSEQG